MLQHRSYLVIRGMMMCEGRESEICCRLWLLPKMRSSRLIYFGIARLLRGSCLGSLKGICEFAITVKEESADGKVHGQHFLLA
jgi:hypothetical protein